MARDATVQEVIEELAKMSPERLMAQNLAHLAERFELPLAELQARIATESQKVTEEDPELEEIEDPYPPFPKLFGPVHYLAELMAPSVAYEYKILHLLNTIGLHLSGKVSFDVEKWIQPRFYSVMLGPPGSSKTAVDKEVRGMVFPKG